MRGLTIDPATAAVLLFPTTARDRTGVSSPPKEAFTGAATKPQKTTRDTRLNLTSKFGLPWLLRPAGIGQRLSMIDNAANARIREPARPRNTVGASQSREGDCSYYFTRTRLSYILPSSKCRTSHVALQPVFYAQQPPPFSPTPHLSHISDLADVRNT